MCGTMFEFKVLRIPFLFLVIIISIPLVFAAALPLKQTSSWSSPFMREIVTGSFTTAPEEMLVVTKGYEPDGDEASCETLVVVKGHESDGHKAAEDSEAELKALRTQDEGNPRRADPTVQMLNVASGKTETIDFGWNPVANNSRSMVYYAHQKKPISGLRVLADTQKGNQIKRWDRATKAIRTLATPMVGYYDDPLLSPDGRLLAYSKNDATNGAWGGQVGIGVIDLATLKEVASLNPRKHHGLFDLVSDMFWTKENKLYAIRHVPNSGGTYVADEYTKKVINVFKPGAKPDPTIARSLFSKDKLNASLEEDMRTVVISPNQLYAAAVTNEDQIRFTQVKSRQTKFLTVGDTPRSAFWSADSKHCQVITSIYKQGQFHHDELRLFTFSTAK